MLSRLAGALLLSLSSAVQFAGDAPVAQTPYGAVRGFVLNSTMVWRGIPYAAPPLGQLRFHSPMPPAAWHSVLNATDFRPSCMQMGSPTVGHYLPPAWRTLNLSNSSEDCLYLNVYAPSNASSLLPVMVYMHAGEFRFGAANDRESNWPNFANGSVLLVTANFRLGLFGFAALDVLRSRDPDGSSGNYGMQDQRAVLRWIRSSIQSFGGDPDRVTLFGESSGGTSVAFHLVSKRSSGLFSRVIVESPGLTQSKTWLAAEANTHFAISALTAAGSQGCLPFMNPPGSKSWRRYPGLRAYGRHPLADASSLPEAIQMCEAWPDCYLISTGNVTAVFQLYGIRRDAAGHPPAMFLRNQTMQLGHDSGAEVLVRSVDHASAVALMDCLLMARAEDLVVFNLSPPFDDTFQTDAAAPTEDGVELLAPLSALVAQGGAPEGVAVLGGSNLDEGTMFMYSLPQIACNATEEEFEAWAVTQYGPELGARVPSLYRSIDQPAPLCRSPIRPGQPTSRAWQAAMRSAGDNAILCRTRELLQSARGRGNRAWWYQFIATPIFSVNSDDLQYLGAFHGAELPFVFGDDFELSSTGERRLSRAMGCYWINFAATGNPNRGPSGCALSQSLPEWPALGDAGDAIEFSNTSIKTHPALKKAQCDLFKQYGSEMLPRATAMFV